MKWLKSIRFSQTGITFPYNGDSITWIYPWGNRGEGVFFSNTYLFGFHYFQGYWDRLNSLEELNTYAPKVQGFSNEEILIGYLKAKYILGTIVVLWDIDYQAKPSSFWAAMPNQSREHFLKDVVVLNCKGLKDASRLAKSSRTFSRVVVIYNGRVITDFDSSL